METVPISNIDYIKKGGRAPSVNLSNAPSSLLLVSNDDASSSKSSMDFNIDFFDTFTDIQSLQLSKVAIALPPNITQHNNQIQLNHNGTLTSYYYVPCGLYNPADLANALVSTINTGLAADSIADTVACSFDYNTFTFNIVSVGVFQFDFVESCSFIRFGKNCCNFQGIDISASPSSTSVKSYRANLIYSRYITINSRALCNNGKAPKSSLSSPYISGWDIIGTVNIAPLYIPEDFSASNTFNGLFRETVPINPPSITMSSNSRIKTPSSMDFRIYDEWGKDFSTCYDDPTNGVYANAGVILFISMNF